MQSQVKLRAALLVFLILFLAPKTYAIVDPLSVPNNKFGIHIIAPTPDESSPAANLVNTNGDWGYITVLIEGRDKNKGKWQEFFDDLRRRHLIPIVRLATIPDGNIWKIPDTGEAQVWADFLDSLNWPVKNRYVVIYNEPNHGKEWGNYVDAKMYAKVLDQTITALKSKNRDFFVLNAGFDASAPSQPPLYQDQVTFMRQMEEEVPGIFNKLDGWVSHSYPNPGFVGSPNASGRGTIRTWLWELQLLRQQFVVTKNLPVFITETGWQHAEGINYNPSFPKADIVANYYKSAFEGGWASQRIIAITPFLLSYQDKLFDHFSFKTTDNATYYPQYHVLQAMDKVSGRPIQDKMAELTKGEIFSTIVSGETYNISLTFKNTGQSIWNSSTSLTTIVGASALGIEKVEIPEGTKIEPGQEFTFDLKVKAPESGSFRVVLNLFEGTTQFDSKPFEFTTEVKSPVILQVKNNLKWKKSPEGEYILRISGVVGDSVQKVYISDTGISDKMDARFLLPEYTFDFTLEKPFYNSVLIKQKVASGVNILDFGELKPNLFSALLNPKEFWSLLPFSN